jgi:hypothetical protein
MLWGEKAKQKQIIVSKLLLLSALKWRVSVGPRKGELFQPSSMAQYLKEIFVDFKKKGIQYDHAKDFNGEGEYHAVLINLWKQEMEKDPLLQELEQQHLTWHYNTNNRWYYGTISNNTI